VSAIAITKQFLSSMCSDPQEFLMYLRKQIYMHFLRVLLF